jgi:hypothetical protein
MKRIITAIALAASFALAAPAMAAPIRECGNYVPVGWAHGAWTGYWTFATVYGFTPVWDLTTRNVRCSDARAFSIAVSRSGAGGGYHNFKCRTTAIGTEDLVARGETPQERQAAYGSKDAVAGGRVSDCLRGRCPAAEPHNGVRE